jgi:hypothetical protein
VKDGDQQEVVVVHEGDPYGRGSKGCSDDAETEITLGGVSRVGNL